MKTSLHEATPERLRSVAALAQAVRFEETTPADRKRLERWIPVIAAARLDAERAGPRLRLRSRLGSTSRGLAEIISQAASWGINELTVMIDRFEGQLDPTGRAAARAALLDLMERSALLDGPVQAPLEHQLMTGQEPLLVTGTGWPPGFQLDLGDRTGEGEARGRCPAGVEAGAPSRHPADPDGRYLSFDLRTCRDCELLAACPVDRVDGRVRLPMLRLRGCAELLTDSRAGGQRAGAADRMGRPAALSDGLGRPANRPAWVGLRLRSLRHRALGGGAERFAGRAVVRGQAQ